MTGPTTLAQTGPHQVNLTPLTHFSQAMPVTPSLVSPDDPSAADAGGEHANIAAEGDSSSTPHLPPIPGSARRASSASGGDVDQMARFATLNRQDSRTKSMEPTPPDQAALDERRRQSIRKMEAGTVSKSIKEAMASAFQKFTTGVTPDADAETKLQQVLISAKECGLSMEKIFSFFSPSSETADIAEEDFAAGLQRLNSDTFQLNATDVKTLVERFDMNKDGKISMEEFVTFTLNIPHLAWRAEKGRRKSLGSTSNLNNPTPALPLEGTQALQTERSHRATKDTPEPTPHIGTARRGSKGQLEPSAPARRGSTDFSVRRGSRGGSIGGQGDLRGSLDRRPSLRPQASTATPRNPNSPPPTGTHAQAAADKEKAALAEKEKAAQLEKEREKAAAACPLVASSRLLESIAPVADKHRGSITAQQSLLPEMTLWGETAKLLWRVRENLVVRFYHHDAPPTIAVVAHNEATSEDYPVLYVSQERLPVDDKALETAIAEKVPKTRPNATAADLTPEELLELTVVCRKEQQMAYLIQRLHIEDGPAAPDGTATRIAVLNKQTGDDWESLYCDKPAMVRAPAPIGAVRRASLAEFRRKSLDLERMANEAKVQATEASRLSQDVALNLPAGESQASEGHLPPVTKP